MWDSNFLDGSYTIFWDGTYLFHLLNINIFIVHFILNAFQTTNVKISTLYVYSRIFLQSVSYLINTCFNSNLSCLSFFDTSLPFVSVNVLTESSHFSVSSVFCSLYFSLVKSVCFSMLLICHNLFFFHCFQDKVPEIVECEMAEIFKHCFQSSQIF